VWYPAPERATLATFLGGTPVLVLVALPSLVRQDLKAVGVAGWAGVAFSGVVAIGPAYLAWNIGLGAIGGARTAVYSNLAPVIAATVAWFTLGERWGAGQFLGAAAVLGGITLTRRGANRPPTTSPDGASITPTPAR
jgi:drug/metabolite transporter (DMT)-like permease